MFLNKGIEENGPRVFFAFIFFCGREMVRSTTLSQVKSAGERSMKMDPVKIMNARQRLAKVAKRWNLENCQGLRGKDDPTWERLLDPKVCLACLVTPVKQKTVPFCDPCKRAGKQKR